MSMNQESHTPHDLRPIESALHSLAQAERASAMPTLEDRIFVATRANLAGIERPLIITVRRRTLSRLRIAAVLALMGCVGALWLARLGQQPGNPLIASTTGSLEKLETDVEFMLAMRSADDGLRSTSDSIDSLFLDTLNIGNSLRTDTPLVDEGSL
jgi:hypothetical protein